MTDSTTAPVDTNTITIPEDLDAFNDMFLGKTKPEEIKESPGEVDTSATDTDAPADTVEDTPAVEETPQEKPKKQTVQERIDELTAARRAAERLADEKDKALRDALARLERIEAKLPDPTPKPAETPKEEKAPSLEDTNEDGTEKYPLGEYDPNYVSDLAKYTIRQELEKAKKEQLKTEEQKAKDEVSQALLDNWAAKTQVAIQEKPDFVEKAKELETTFEDIDPGLGEYLAAVIMSMENSTDVFYHLASNIDEAKEIVKSGPVKATMALGKIAARLETLETKQPEDKPKPKLSNAPEPPPVFNKGTMASDVVRADTDDLAAFEKLFYKRK